MFLRILLFLTFSLLISCGGGGSGGDGSSQGDTSNEGGGGTGGGGDSDPETSPTFVRLSNTTCQAPDLDTLVGDYSFSPAFPNLPVLAQPLAMKQLPNDNGVWLLAQREGLIVTFANDPNTNSVDTVLDIRAQVATNGEFGLTGFAIHPNFPSDNRLFVLYSDANQANRSTLSSFDMDTQNLTLSNEQALLTLDQPATNHNGGNIAFGPDGFLYIAFGDGGENANASQNLSVLHGSMLRIDINGSFPYSIPADNPFNNGQALCTQGESADTCPEIFAYGFRNPWRWSFDSLTGDLWLGDVGQATFEEIDKVIAGGNYGWPTMEANSCLNAGCITDGLQFPVTQYNRDVGISIVGGYVYRGTDMPELSGQYIFGDTFSPSVLNIPADSNNGVTSEPLTTSNFTLGSFAQSNTGEIYALDLSSSEVGDGIYRLNRDGAMIAALPENLSETGCFDTQSKMAEEGVVPYQVNSQLWSDGAEKSRSFAIPDGTTIDIDAQGDFIFPEGSVLIKHFLAGSRYLETRFMVNLSSGWLGYSYEWNAAQTDAVLVAEGNELVDAGSFAHTIPSRNQCFECHTGAAGFSLGLEVAQQHYTTEILDSDNQTISANFIDYLNQTYFTAPFDVEQFPALVAIDDSSASIENRARSYLHSNCSSCHRLDSSASYMDLRYSTLLSDTNMCNIAANEGDFGFPGANRLSPGNAEQSVLLLRMQSEDNRRMPPVASMVPHDAATTVIAEWINSLNACN